jgi:hypothetical protein
MVRRMEKLKLLMMLHHVTKYLMDLSYFCNGEKYHDKKLESKSSSKSSSSPIQNLGAVHINHRCSGRIPYSIGAFSDSLER